MNAVYGKVKEFIEENGDRYQLCQIEDILDISEETLLEILRQLKEDNVIAEKHHFETGCLNKRICSDCFQPMEHEDTLLEETSESEIRYKYVYRCPECFKKEIY